MALGEAEWAATQTVHFAASVALECWCVINAIADQNVSNMHTNATLFEIDRITATPFSALLESIPKKDPKAMRVRCAAMLEADKGPSPLVTKRHLGCHISPAQSIGVLLSGRPFLRALGIRDGA